MSSGSRDSRIKTALLCDYAVTGQDGKVSAIGIFSGISFQALPANYPRFFVVVIADLDPGEHEGRLQMLAPSGQLMIPPGPSMGISVPDPAAETNLIIAFDNLGFQTAGIHQLQLTIDGSMALSLPFAVMSAGEPAFTARGNA